VPERVIAKSPEQAKAGARERIIAAAFAVLAQRGARETSVKEVAKAAGVAPGLVHYYFATKGELLLEVVRETCRAYREELARVDLPADPIASTRALLAWSKRRGMEMPDWFRLLVDLDAMALREPDLAREVSVLKAEVRANTAALVAAVEQKLGAALGPGREGIASVIVPAIDGLILQKLIDPTFDIDAGFAALEAMLVSLLRAARPAIG
jgi:AcrR family transcriptional regulator